MRYLSLRDPEAIADFIESVIEYLPEKERAEYEILEKAILAQEPMDPQEVQEQILALGKRTWVPRRAVDFYTKTIPGARREWQKLEESLRPATLFLISRVRRNTSAMTLEEALRTGEADYALDDDERVEIQLLQLEIRIELWLEDKDELKTFIREAEGEFEAIEDRLRMAIKNIEKIEDRKLRIEAEARLEDVTERLFFLAEAISVDLIDQELQGAS
jgi:hypothetical protein